jgi:hypothetical protein
MTPSHRPGPFAFRGVLAMLSLAALAACGGGGSDSGGGPDSSGLVPAPPALGMTLFTDATVLRPLVPGARWSYGGLTPSGAAYANSVSQAALPEGVLESSSNTLAAGSNAVHLVARDQGIVQPDAIDVDGDGVTDIGNVIELRAPVRVNDQYVAFDRHLPGTVPDADGDGQAETLDLAIYSRVIGVENVLPTGLDAISAVRVDRVVVARITLSKTGIASPAVKATQSVWYGEGIGIVRQHLDAPADDGLSRAVTDETITGWTGL